MVAQLRYGLIMAGCKTVALDTGGGLALDAARLMTPRDALIAVSFEPYTAETLEIAETAVAQGVPVLALADSTLGPVAGLAQVLFTVPEHQVAASRAIGAAIALAQVLVLCAQERRAQSSKPEETRVQSDIASSGTGGTPS